MSRPDPIHFDTLSWQDGLPGARFKLYREGKRQLRLVEFSSEFVEPDWCEKGHTGYVLEGTLEIDFKSHKITYPQGSDICIPPGPDTGHKAKPLTPVVKLILIEEVEHIQQ